MMIRRTDFQRLTLRLLGAIIEQQDTILSAVGAYRASSKPLLDEVRALLEPLTHPPGAPHISTKSTDLDSH